MAGNHVSKSPARQPWLFLLVLGLAACSGSNSYYENKADAPKTIAAIEERTPLPPRSTFDPIPVEADRQYQKGVFEQRVQHQAQCKWYMHWLMAFAGRDTAAMGAASEMMRTMRGWALFTVSDISFQRLVDAIEERASLGDPTGIQDFVRLNCTGVKP